MSVEDLPPAGRRDLLAWPGGREETLAKADYHGRWVRWLAP
jgi:hypothetical protein